jgi:hypothetical protein
MKSSLSVQGWWSISGSPGQRLLRQSSQAGVDGLPDFRQRGLAPLHFLKESDD